MPRDFIEIGCSPVDEPCVQVSRTADYLDAMRAECRAFRHQLERTFPKATFQVKTFQHEFGAYMEVCAMFNSSDEVMPFEEAEREAAFEAEANTPALWDATALKELQQSEAWTTYRAARKGA